MSANTSLYNCQFDQSGFIDYTDGQTLTPSLSEDAVHWTHLSLTDSEHVEWLKTHSGLSQSAIDMISAEETRPRSIPSGKGLIIILRALNMTPGQDAENMVSVRIWISEKRIISARRQVLMSVTDVYQELKAGRGPRSEGSFLTELINSIADRIGDFVNTIEDDVGAAEELLETAKPGEFRAALSSLRRQIAVVRRFLAPQRDALDRLNHLPSAFLDEHDRQRLREESDRISRYLEDLDLAREQAVVLQESFVTQMAQEQNSRMYVLSVVAAIFLPLTFITGLFGMNVGGLPGVESPLGFAAAMIIMLVASLAMILYFKKRKWF